MRCEAASGGNVRLFEMADGQFRGSDVPQNVGFLVCVRCVVRLLPLGLQHDERFGEVADFRGKLLPLAGMRF